MEVPEKTIVVNENKEEFYSVWAIPPDEVRATLKKLMEGLRSEFGGPHFEPHITVVKAISLTADDALVKFKSACDGLKSYNCTVDSVVTGHCVSLRLHPTAEMTERRSHCFAHFGNYQASTPYTPHMSLLYGDQTDDEKKKAQEQVYKIDESIGSLSFPITCLQLWKTDPEDPTLKSWEMVAECNLSPN